MNSARDAGLTAAQAMRGLQKLVMLIGDRQHELGLRPVPSKPVKHGGQLSNPYQLDVNKFFETYCSAHGINQFNSKQLAALIISFCEQCGVRLPFRHQTAESGVSARSMNCVMFNAAAAHTVRRMRGFALPDGTVPLTAAQFCCLMTRRPWRQLLPAAMRHQLVEQLMQPVSARLRAHGSRTQRVWEELSPQFSDQVCGARVTATIRALWRGAKSVPGSVTGGASRVIFDSFTPVWHARKMLGLYHELIKRFPPSRRNLFLKRDGSQCPFRSLYNADVIESHLRDDLAQALAACEEPRQEMQLAAENLIEEFKAKQLTTVGAVPINKVLKAAAAPVPGTSDEDGGVENLEKAHKEVRKASKRLRKREPPLEEEAVRLDEFNAEHTDRMLEMLKKVEASEMRIYEGIPLAQLAERRVTNRVEAILGLRIRRAARDHQAKVGQMTEGSHKDAAIAALRAAPRVELSYVGLIEMLHMKPWVHWANDEVLCDTELFWRQAFAQQVGFLPPCCTSQLDSIAVAVAERSLREMRSLLQSRLRASLLGVQACITDKESCEYSLMEDKLGEWHQEKLAVDAHNATRTRQPVDPNQSKVPVVRRGDTSKALQFEAQVSRLKVEGKFLHVAHLLTQRPWCWLLPPGVEQEVKEYLIQARCFERSFMSQILHHQSSNRNPPALQYTLKDLRFHEVYFSFVHNKGIPVVELKRGSLGREQIARSLQLSEVELPQAELEVSQIQEEMDDSPTRGEKDKLRKPLSKAKRARDKLKAELQECNPAEGTPEWHASNQTVESQHARALHHRAAQAAASVMSEIESGVPSSQRKRAQAIFARQLRHAQLEEKEDYTFMDFGLLFVCKPWIQALPLVIRQEVRGLAAAEACKQAVSDY